jgi:hypothetical protein
LAAYLDLNGFKLRSEMPDEDIDLVEQRYPGYIVAKLDEETAWINGRLRKRYAVPFKDPVPTIVLAWLAKIVTPAIYKKRGWNPSSEEDQDILKGAENARAEAKEAADSNEGLFELPLRQDLPGTTGVQFGGPLGYSEADPYTWTDRQADEVRNGR